MASTLDRPGRRLAGRVQRLIEQGNARRVRISQGGATVAEFPLTLGVIGGLVAPQVAAAGLIAGYLLGTSISIEPVEARGQETPEPGSDNTQRAIVREFYDAMNRHDIDSVLGLWNGNPVWHGPIVGSIRGQFALRLLLAQLLMAFPDFQQTVEDMICEGDTVAVRVTSRGTHTGALIGIAPTGREVVLQSNAVFRLANGRIVEEWEQSDMLGLMQQIGVMPSPPPDS